MQMFGIAISEAIRHSATTFNFGNNLATISTQNAL